MWPYYNPNLLYFDPNLNELTLLGYQMRYLLDPGQTGGRNDILQHTQNMMCDISVELLQHTQIHAAWCLNRVITTYTNAQHPVYIYHSLQWRGDRIFIFTNALVFENQLSSVNFSQKASNAEFWWFLVLAKISCETNSRVDGNLRRYEANVTSWY